MGRGRIQEALGRMANIPPLLKGSSYLDKIVARTSELKSQQGIYLYAGNLFTKASKLAKYHRYEIALAVLNTFGLVPGKKPKELQSKLETLKEKIARERNTYKRDQEKIAKLPWYAVIHKRDLFNWQYNPVGSEYWDGQDYILMGKGSGSGAKASWIVLETIPTSKDPNNVDGLEGEELKNYICRFQFKIIEGSGFDFWARVIRDSNKLNALPLSTTKFKIGRWYDVRVVIRGSKIHLLCSTNFF